MRLIQCGKNTIYLNQISFFKLYPYFEFDANRDHKTLRASGKHLFEGIDYLICFQFRNLFQHHRQHQVSIMWMNLALAVAHEENHITKRGNRIGCGTPHLTSHCILLSWLTQVCNNTKELHALVHHNHH